MADDPIDTLRLFLMQDLLPVGIAIIERARKGGTFKATEPFTSSEDPFQLLRKEGETAAKIVREQLDKVRPGLGNPVVPVKVEVEERDPCPVDTEVLMDCLDRLQLGMEELEILLDGDCSKNATYPTDEG
tara:strand:- start:108 stop:497 length:390 start_codon:yes stop_codon:yes gene_type:complete